jgi:hypothetical protein
MIHANAYAAVLPLATLAAEKGMTIVAMSGTPLAELVKTSTLVGESPFLVPEGTTVDINKQMSSYTDNIPHNERFDFFVKSISDAVNGHFAFARNTVTAAIARITNSVIASMEGIEPNPVSLFNVEMRSIPEPMEQDSFRDSLQGDIVKSLLAPQFYFRFPYKDTEFLTKLAMTGSSVMDNRIADWLAKEEQGLLANTWAKYFTDPEASGGQQAHLEHASQAEMLAANLFVRKLKTDMLQDSGLTLDQYNTAVQQYSEATATYLMNGYKAFTQLANSDMLVYARNSEKRSISVNAEVYRKWISAGGKNEVLFGMLVVGGPLLSTVAEIEERKQDFLQAWAHFVNLSNTRFRNDSFMRFTNALRNSFFVDMKNLDEQEKSLLDSNSHYIERISALFEQELELIAPAEQLDIARVVTKLVCKSRYFYTDSYKILSEIDEHMKADRTMSVEDAAAMAHIEVVADFVAAQLKLV